MKKYAILGRSGFTLIELLVVIAIIALLVAMLMPSLRTAKHLAHQAVCMSNTRHISTSMHMYASDNDGWLPPSPGAYMNCSLTFYAHYDTKPPYGYTQLGLLYEGKYASDPTLFYCPANENYGFQYPEDWNIPKKRTSYLYAIFSQPAGGFPPRPNINIVSAPLTMCLLADIFVGGDGYGRPLSWPHESIATGLSVAYTDAHAEFVMVDPDVYDTAIEVSIADIYYRDRFAWCFWELLEGDVSVMRKAFP